MHTHTHTLTHAHTHTLTYKYLPNARYIAVRDDRAVDSSHKHLNDVASLHTQVIADYRDNSTTFSGAILGGKLCIQAHTNKHTNTHICVSEEAGYKGDVHTL